MKFKITESKTLADYFKYHKLYRDWNDFLENGRIDDMQSIASFVDLTPEQKEELRRALDEKIKKNNDEYYARLKDPVKNPTEKLENELEVIAHIDFQTGRDKKRRDDIRAELERRKGVK
jgi:hypothetical protein